MPLGGETIGRAYIKIYADGSGLGDSVDKEMAKADGPIKAAGSRQGKAYADEFKKRSSQEDIGKNIRQSLERGIAKSDIAQSYFGSRNWQRFQGVLKKRFGDEGEAAGKELSREFAHNLSGIDDAVEGIMPRIEKMRRDLVASGKDVDLGTFTVHMDVQEDVDIDKTTEKVRKLGDEVQTSDRKMGLFRRTLVGASRGLVNIGERVDVDAKKFSGAFGKGSRNDAINFFGSFVSGTTSAIAGLVKFSGHLLGVFDPLKDGTDEARSFGKAFTGIITSVLTSLPALAIAVAAIITSLSLVTTALSLLAGAIVAIASSIAFALVGALAPIAGLVAPIGLAIAGVVAGLVGIDKKSKTMLKEAVKPLIDGFKDLGKAVRSGFVEGLKDTSGIDSLHQTLEGLRPLFRIIGRSIGDMLGQFGEFTQGAAFQRFMGVMKTSLPRTFRQLGNIFGNVGTGILNVFTELSRKGGPVDEFLTWLGRITGKFAEWSGTAEGRRQIREFFEKASESAHALGVFITGVWDVLQPLLAAGKDSGDDIFTKLGRALSKFGDYLSSPQGKKDLKQWIQDGEDFADNIGDLAVAFAKFADAADDPNTRKSVEGIMKALAITIDYASLVMMFNGLALAMQAIGVANSDFKSDSGLFGALNRFGTTIGEKIGPAVDKVHEVVDNIVGFFRAMPGRIGNALSGIGAFVGRVVDRIGAIFKRLPGEIVRIIASIPGRITRLFDRVAFGVGFAVGRIVKFFRELPGKIGGALSRVGSAIRSRFSDAVAKIPGLVDRIVTFFQRLPGRVGRALAAAPGIIAQKFRDAADKIPGIVDKIVHGFSTLARRISGAIGNIWSSISSKFTSIPGHAETAATGIVSAFTGLAGRILNAIGNINIASLVTWPAGRVGNLVRGFLAGASAAGGIYAGPQVRLIGEAGPEAIVPLNRPLHLVDPAVRELSAIAQGLKAPPTARGGVVGTPGKVINVGGMQIITPTRDPVAVANEVVNRLVAVGY